MIIPLQPPRLSPNALTVLRQRYLAKNERGIAVESPADRLGRVARDIASAEPIAQRRSLAHQFYEVMASLTFFPNSPTLMNAGRPLQQLSACFVFPVGDSLESIFDAVKHQALIHQSGGGTGFSFSHIRPHADHVATICGLAQAPFLSCACSICPRMSSSKEGPGGVPTWAF